MVAFSIRTTDQKSRFHVVMSEHDAHDQMNEVLPPRILAMHCLCWGIKRVLWPDCRDENRYPSDSASRLLNPGQFFRVPPFTRTNVAPLFSLVTVPAGPDLQRRDQESVQTTAHVIG